MAYCESAGAELVSIESMEEFAFITEKMKSEGNFKYPQKKFLSQQQKQRNNIK